MLGSIWMGSICHLPKACKDISTQEFPKNCSAVGGKKYGKMMEKKAWGFRAGKTCKTSPQRPRSSEKPWHPGLHLSIFGLGRVHDSCPNIKNSNIFEMPQTPVVFFATKTGGERHLNLPSTSLVHVLVVGGSIWCCYVPSLRWDGLR